jgi:hypothetical protein
MQVGKLYDPTDIIQYPYIFFQIPNAWRKPIGRSNELLLAEIKNKQDAGHVNYGTTEQTKK